MKKILFLITAICLIQAACKEPLPHIIFNDQDSVKIDLGRHISKDNYGGSIPGMDAKITDYTWPDPYQHIPQMLRDSTWATSWDQAGFPNAKNFIEFIKDFQFDLREKKKEKIADMIIFPLSNYKTKKEFIVLFDSIFGPDFTYEVFYQNPKEIFRNQNGAMLGNDGQIWFKQVGGSYKIISIKP